MKKESNFKQIRVKLGICYEKFNNFDYIKKLKSTLQKNSSSLGSGIYHVCSYISSLPAHAIWNDCGIF